jgi:CRP-like cAMP-binding protein
MFTEFKNYLLSKAPFTIADIEKIRAISTLKNVSKGDLILQADTIWNYNAFVSSGLFCTYYLDDLGGKHIKNFAHKNYWVGDRESLLTQKPSLLNIEAIEDGELVMIHQNDFHVLRREVDLFNKMMQGLVQNNNAFTQARISANMSVSDHEKYENFLKKYMPVAHRIPHDMIASYLEMSPETLSRVINSK